MKTFGRFALHTLLSTIIVLLVTPIVFSPVAAILRTNQSPYLAYTGSAPFPMHLVVGCVMGFFWHRRFHHAEALWVWILPFALFLLRFVSQQDPATGVLFTNEEMNKWQLFLGHKFTFDERLRYQILMRMVYVAPLFASASYSIGAYLQRANVFGFKPYNEDSAQSAPRGDNF